VSPGGGAVVGVHDGEPDHHGRRSQLALVPYLLGQAGRLRQGVAALAGNHVTIALARTGVVAVLAHLQRGSIEVRVGPGARDAGSPGQRREDGAQGHTSVRRGQSAPVSSWASITGMSSGPRT
jgi:hypothetical protein